MKSREEDSRFIKVAQKDKRAFGALYDKYFEQIYLFIFKRIGDEERAGDICQEAMLKAMHNISRYEDRGAPFAAWLYRIASNEVNLYFRKKKKEFEVEVQEKHVISLMEEVKLGDTVSEDDQEKLINILNSVSPEHLEIIELRFFMQQSFKEIAEFYNISEANAKMRLYRILEKIKKDWT